MFDSMINFFVVSVENVTCDNARQIKQIAKKRKGKPINAIIADEILRVIVLRSRVDLKNKNARYPGMQNIWRKAKRFRHLE